MMMREKIINNKNSIYLSLIILITSIIMFIISVTMYFNLSKPKFYNTFIEQGNKYLNESKYEKSILEFKKAKQLEPKSTEVRVGNAKGYIGINKVDNAVEELKEAQNLDIENTKLLLEILSILQYVDSESTYDILQNYVDKTQNSIPNNIQQIINNSNDNPKIPESNPSPGIYINPINIKLEFNEIVVGNTFYYTLDKSEPSKESIKYNQSINIEKSSTIKLIVYNHKGESSEIITLDYIIDDEMMHKIEQLLKECELLVQNTNEGRNIGNCLQGSKEKFENVIKQIKTSLEQDAIGYETANEMYEKLSNALEEFKYNIIEETDKSVLKETIDKAQNIYDKSTEGSNEGQYKVGSKSKLLKSIKEAQSIYDDILSKQENIDNGVYSLNQAINTFNNSKVVLFNEQQAINILKLKDTNRIDKQKREEFSGSGFILESSHTVVDEGIINGKRYYEIIYSIKIYLESGELYYDEMYDEYVEYNIFGTVYHVYEDGYIEEIEFFN